MNTLAVPTEGTADTDGILLHIVQPGSGGTAILAESYGLQRDQTSGTAIQAQTDSGTGVYGVSQTGNGVVGQTNTATGGGAAVWGSNAGTGYGLKGTSALSDGTGVRGEGGYGVDGQGDIAGVSGTGINGGTGVDAWNFSGGEGVFAHADSIGVFGSSDSGTGVLGYSNMGQAGMFIGNVLVSGDLLVLGKIHNIDLDSKLAALGIPQPDVTPTGAGSGVAQGGDFASGGSGGGGNFVIDHPLEPARKLLSHAAVKSPEMMNIYDGVVILGVSGKAVVRLPKWCEALNENFRYQLTPIGSPAPNLYVAQKIAGNAFTIAGGSRGMEVAWQVTGTRKDPYARAHPFIVEKNKDVKARGYYVHPEVYRKPAARDIRLILNPAWVQRRQEILGAAKLTSDLVGRLQVAASERRLKARIAAKRAQWQKGQVNAKLVRPQKSRG